MKIEAIEMTDWVCPGCGKLIASLVPGHWIRKVEMTLECNSREGSLKVL
jgi:hypothetical protein